MSDQFDAEGLTSPDESTVPQQPTQASGEEQQNRTYKGILFSSVEEMEQVQTADGAASEFCRQASDKSYKELWDKREELGKLPDAIFGGYIVQLMHYMAAAEEREVQEIIQEIGAADLDNLGSIVSRPDIRLYSQGGQQRIYAAANNREKECRIAVLDNLVAGAGDKTLDELEAVKKSITELGYPDVLAAGYVKHIGNLMDEKEKQDLNELCAGVPEAESIDELKLLISTITGRYREAFYSPFVAQIWRRIDYLYDRQLGGICTGVEAADREQLAVISSNVDALECRDLIKNPYRERIGRRTLELDIQDLEEATSDLESRGLQELQSIYDDLSAGHYNADYVEGYKKKVLSWLERAQAAHLDEILSDIDTMSGQEVNEARNRIKELGYADHVINDAMRRLHNRQLEVELRQLIAIRNDFDAMTADDIRQVRLEVNRMDLLKESRDFYEDKLYKREWSIALYNVSPYISFVNQVMSRNPVSVKGCCLPILANGYENEVRRFWGNYNNSDVYDMPVFMLQGDIYIVITLNGVYVKSGNGYLKFRLSEVQGFTTVNKILFESISLTLSNNTSVNLSGFITKKNMPALIEALSAALFCVKNPDSVRQNEPYFQSVGSITGEDIEALKSGRSSQQGANPAQPGSGQAQGMNQPQQGAVRSQVQPGTGQAQGMNQSQPGSGQPQNANQAQPQIRFCTNCGSRVMPGMKFCTNCGKPQ
ncbi:MAG: hypothetical protein LIO37_05455 [Clostridiales bacterium]|nr:hypothetical protein [Clostridiales bacterium]